MQTKKQSLLESVINTAIGFIVSMLSQIFIYGVMRIPVTISKSVLLTLFFTVVSIIRSYIIRRIFNKKTIK
jgi:hypothetical protein